VIVGRDEQKLNNAKEKLGELCYPVACDVSDPDINSRVGERHY
jgi:NADP-dependent 3-hydroxy acid dehydrogenase YdfG